MSGLPAHHPSLRNGRFVVTGFRRVERRLLETTPEARWASLAAAEKYAATLTDEVVEIVRWAPLSRFPGSPWGSQLVRRTNRTEVSS